MSTSIDQNSVLIVPVTAHLLPDEGPKAIPLILDFSGTVTDYALDLTESMALGRISMVQTLFLDLSGAGVAQIVVTVNQAGNGQQITVKPGMQGYFNVACPNPAKFNFHSTAGSGIIRAALINVLIPGHSWATA